MSSDDVNLYRRAPSDTFGLTQAGSLRLRMIAPEQNQSSILVRDKQHDIASFESSLLFASRSDSAAS